MKNLQKMDAVLICSYSKVDVSNQMPWKSIFGTCGITYTRLKVYMSINYQLSLFWHPRNNVVYVLVNSS